VEGGRRRKRRKEGEESEILMNIVRCAYTHMYLNNQLRYHHVKHFLDSVCRCVDNVSSLLHCKD
jgi:hypothetical protein